MLTPGRRRQIKKMKKKPDDERLQRTTCSRLLLQGRREAAAWRRVCSTIKQRASHTPALCSALPHSIYKFYFLFCTASALKFQHCSTWLGLHRSKGGGGVIRARQTDCNQFMVFPSYSPHIFQREVSCTEQDSGGPVQDILKDVPLTVQPSFEFSQAPQSKETLAPRSCKPLSSFSLLVLGPACPSLPNQWPALCCVNTS